MSQNPIFVDEAGSVTVDGFTDEILISPELLAMARMSVVGVEITFTCANGHARYRKIGERHGALVCALIEGTPRKDAPCPTNVSTGESE